MRAPMDESNPAIPPPPSARARRGGMSSQSPATPDAAVEAEMASYQRVLENRLDQGLQAIHQSANALMHEIASEGGRGGGGGKDTRGSPDLGSPPRDHDTTR